MRDEGDLWVWVKRRKETTRESVGCERDSFEI